MSSDVTAAGRKAVTTRQPPQAAESQALAHQRRRRRMLVYDAVLRLRLRHEYYGPDEGFPIEILPTRETRDMLHDRGLLFRVEPGGCVVLSHTAHRVGSAPAVQEAWVTFLIHGDHEHFALVSDGDLDAEYRTDCAYVDAPADGDPVPAPARLRPERLPVLPTVVQMAAGPGDTIEVVRHRTSVMSLRWSADSPAPVVSDPALACDPANRQVRIDLGELPIGRYSIQQNGRAVRDGVRLAGPRVPDLIAELQLPPPTNAEKPRPDGGACAQYEVVFAARRIVWKYSIVPRTGTGPLDSLAIDVPGNGASSSAGAIPRFLGPFEDTLPNGARAYQFLSETPIALQRRSTVRLRLTGRRKDRMTRDSVLVECLPVPGRHQLALLTDRDAERLGADDRYCAEMFVYV